MGTRNEKHGPLFKRKIMSIFLPNIDQLLVEANRLSILTSKDSSVKEHFHTTQIRVNKLGKLLSKQKMFATVAFQFYLRSSRRLNWYLIYGNIEGKETY